LHRRRLERERIGLCGVLDVWGKVQEEDHPQELVICSAINNHYITLEVFVVAEVK